MKKHLLTKLYRHLSGIAVSVVACSITFGCGEHRVKNAQVVPPKPVCLVLSVGEQKGIAHIGVIHALHERGVKVDCVVGTSMGSLIGGLFASDPQNDPANSYRKIFAEYEKKTRSAAGNSGFLGLLIGGAALAASGGAAALAGALGGGMVGSSSVELKNWSRLEKTLQGHFDGRRIENLPVHFVTQYRRLSDADSQTVTGGFLADEIARSIKNPLLFTDLKTTPDSIVDPGLSPLAAVPLNTACGAFPDHQLVVSNVTGTPAQRLAETACPYQEIKIILPKHDPGRAIRGFDPEFSELVLAGYSAAISTLDWNTLPRLMPVSSDRVEQIRIKMAVEARPTKTNGKSWDIGGGRPEIVLGLVVSGCKGCDTYGTSDGNICKPRRPRLINCNV